MVYRNFALMIIAVVAVTFSVFLVISVVLGQPNQSISSALTSLAATITPSEATRVAAGLAIKATVVAFEQTRAAELARITPPPKTPVPAMTSCRHQYATGIFRIDERMQPLPEVRGERITNYASALPDSEGFQYVIYAGSPGDTLEQGLFRVIKEPLDACAVKVPRSIRDFRVMNGPLTILDISGAVVTFSRGDSTTGRFNFVAGQFLQPEATPTTMPMTPTPTRRPYP